MAKKRMHIYGIIGILENFWPITWPNLIFFNGTKFVRLLLSSYIFMHVLARYLKKCGFYSQKTPKISQNQPYISVCTFCPIVITKNESSPKFFNIFA